MIRVTKNFCAKMYVQSASLIEFKYHSLIMSRCGELQSYKVDISNGNLS